MAKTARNKRSRRHIGENDEKMKKAVDAVVNQGMSVRKAAKLYSVTQTPLFDRVKKAKITKRCEACMTKDGIKYCVECKKRLCKLCVTSHREIQATNHHSLVELSAANRSNVPTTQQAMPGSSSLVELLAENVTATQQAKPGSSYIQYDPCHMDVTDLGPSTSVSCNGTNGQFNSNPETNSSSNIHGVKCRQHQEKLIESICQTCQQLLCELCRSRHTGHRMVDVILGGGELHHLVGGLIQKLKHVTVNAVTSSELALQNVKIYEIAKVDLHKYTEEFVSHSKLLQDHFDKRITEIENTMVYANIDDYILRSTTMLEQLHTLSHSVDLNHNLGVLQKCENLITNTQTKFGTVSKELENGEYITLNLKILDSIRQQVTLVFKEMLNKIPNSQVRRNMIPVAPLINPNLSNTDTTHDWQSSVTHTLNNVATQSKANLSNTDTTHDWQSSVTHTHNNVATQSKAKLSNTDTTHDWQNSVTHQHNNVATQSKAKLSNTDTTHDWQSSVTHQHNNVATQSKESLEISDISATQSVTQLYNRPNVIADSGQNHSESQNTRDCSTSLFITQNNMNEISSDSITKDNFRGNGNGFHNTTVTDAIFTNDDRNDTQIQTGDPKLTVRTPSIRTSASNYHQASLTNMVSYQHMMPPFTAAQHCPGNISCYNQSNDVSGSSVPTIYDTSIDYSLMHSTGSNNINPSSHVSNTEHFNRNQPTDIVIYNTVNSLDKNSDNKYEKSVSDIMYSTDNHNQSQQNMMELASQSQPPKSGNKHHAICSSQSFNLVANQNNRQAQDINNTQTNSSNMHNPSDTVVDYSRMMLQQNIKTRYKVKPVLVLCEHRPGVCDDQLVLFDSCTNHVFIHKMSDLKQYTKYTCDVEMLKMIRTSHDRFVAMDYYPAALHLLQLKGRKLRTLDTMLPDTDSFVLLICAETDNSFIKCDISKNDPSDDENVDDDDDSDSCVNQYKMSISRVDITHDKLVAHHITTVTVKGDYPEFLSLTADNTRLIIVTEDGTLHTVHLHSQDVTTDDSLKEHINGVVLSLYIDTRDNIMISDYEQIHMYTPDKQHSVVQKMDERVLGIRVNNGRMIVCCEDNDEDQYYIKVFSDKHLQSVS